MNERDDYLWNRTGSDPEIERLERLLAPYAHTAAHTAPRRGRASSPATGRRRRRWRVVLAAAAVLAVCAVGLQTWYRQRLLWPEDHPWQIATMRDATTTGGREGAEAMLAPGEEVHTGRTGLARLRIARIGEIALGPESRLRLETTRTGHHRVQLLEGRLWARVWAPPGQFGVGLPGAEVLDLGCEFILDSDAHGNGTLTVRSGWVQVDTGRDEVLVPMHATVELRANAPPGTPRDLGASDAFVAALRAIDARGGNLAPDDADIRRLAAAARPQDAISLLSLLQRHPALAQGPLYDRLRVLLPDAPAISREAIRSGGGHALSPWWNALPYPRIKQWWMQWPDALPTGDPPAALFEQTPGGG